MELLALIIPMILGIFLLALSCL